MNSRIFLALGTALTFSMSPAIAQDKDNEKPPVPEDLINDPHFREEQGLNEFTAPSIEKIFDQLDQLTPLPIKDTRPKIPKRMPLDRADLSLEIGLLIAEGFLAVQSGNMDDIEPLAKDLSRYAKALGAGEKVNRHAASILENAKKNNIKQLKKELSATQLDVELELIRLRDIDLAHLISLGGWIRALGVSSEAVNTKFTLDRAKILYREDIADYYEYSLSSLNPKLAAREDFAAIKKNVTSLRAVMLLKEGQKPTEAGVKLIQKHAKELTALALKRKK